MPKIQRLLCLSLILQILLALSAAAGVVPIEASADNIIASRIEGRWIVSRDLSAKLSRSPSDEGYLVFRLDAGAAQQVPSDFLPLFAGKQVYAAGRLSFGSTDLLFYVTEEHGNPRVICFRPGNTDPAKVRSIYLSLIPGRDFRDDLLFLGFTSPRDPFVAYERAPGEQEMDLSPQTQQLMMELRQSSRLEKMQELVQRPDWQKVLDILTAEVRRDPAGASNNRCLMAEWVLRAHLADARIDIAPYIEVLKNKAPFEQQKAAQVIAVASKRRELLTGQERPAIQALIPLTASQRGRVVGAALDALHTLTGRTDLTRDPEAWARWFKETYGEELPVADFVYESLVIVRSGSDPKGNLTFSLNGSEVSQLAKLETELRTRAEAAKALGLQLSIVYVADGDLTSETLDATSKSPAVSAIEKAIIQAGLGQATITLAPSTDTFYPLFPLNSRTTAQIRGDP